MLQWLTNPAEIFEQFELFGAAESESANRFIVSAEFENWRSDGPGFIWVHGLGECADFAQICCSNSMYLSLVSNSAGSGKTILWSV